MMDQMLSLITVVITIMVDMTMVLMSLLLTTEGATAEITVVQTMEEDMMMEAATTMVAAEVMTMGVDMMMEVAAATMTVEVMMMAAVVVETTEQSVSSGIFNSKP